MKTFREFTAGSGGSIQVLLADVTIVALRCLNQNELLHKVLHITRTKKTTDQEKRKDVHSPTNSTSN